MNLPTLITPEQRRAKDIRAKLMGGIPANGINLAERKILHDKIASLSEKVISMRVDNRNLLHAIEEKDAIIRAHEQTINNLTDGGNTSTDRQSAKDIIMKSLEDFPHVSYGQVMGATRSLTVVEARHTCIFALHRARPDLSLPQIGRIFGGRDHTSIMHAIRKMEKLHEPKA